MNENWSKEQSTQCAIDRKMLSDVHMAVCGDADLGVPGLVGDMKNVKARLVPLENAATGGVSIGRAATVVGSFVLGLFAVAGAIVAIVEFIKK